MNTNLFVNYTISTTIILKYVKQGYKLNKLQSANTRNWNGAN